MVAMMCMTRTVVKNSTIYEMSGVPERPFWARNRVNGGPNTYATAKPIGIVSRLMRLTTAPLRKPLKASRITVAMKRMSTQLNVGMFFVPPAPLVPLCFTTFQNTIYNMPRRADR